jgi:hypothetical protein
MALRRAMKFVVAFFLISFTAKGGSGWGCIRSDFSLFIPFHFGVLSLTISYAVISLYWV